MAIQYREAGAILDRLASGNGSLRALLYSKNNKAPIPILYAILTETLKCKSGSSGSDPEINKLLFYLFIGTNIFLILMYNFIQIRNYWIK